MKYQTKIFSVRVSNPLKSLNLATNNLSISGSAVIIISFQISLARKPILIWLTGSIASGTHYMHKIFRKPRDVILLNDFLPYMA